MRHTITLLILLLFTVFTSIQSQVNFNLEKVGELSYSQRCSDVWGYVDDNGNEYAILGTQTGTAIVALDGPDAPKEIEFIPGTSSTWRDMKSYGDRVYVTTDVGEDGLLIINMSMVEDDSISHHFWKPVLELDSTTLGPLNKCHNIYADENGYAYLAGCNVYGGGVLIFDLITQPDTPQLIGASDPKYAHDCYARDSLLFTSDIFAGEVSIYNVSDKTSPLLVARQSTSGNFTHNAWSSDDNNYVFTTDEIVGGFVDAYDISDPDNIRRLDSWQPDNAFNEGIIPHNTHYYDGYLVTSWYTEGVIVLDASQADNLVLVGQYDTYEDVGTRFNGDWGAYPFLPSGRILVSDINSGLFIFEPNYVRAARIEGIVSEMKSGNAIADVSVTIHDTLETETSTTGNGFYKLGTAHFGDLVVSYRKRGYVTHYDTLSFTEGANIMNDVQLKLASNYEWQITVLDSASGEPIDSAQVKLVAEDGTEFERTTDSNGQLVHPQITEGVYTAYAGKWGHNEIYVDNIILDTNQSDTFYLSTGYKDYFNLDLGWETSFDSATTGFWTRAIPIGTSLEGRTANPREDSQNDFGEFAFITGNDGLGGGAGTDDIDNGNVILKSPWMDITAYKEPSISFDYWFFMDGGNTEPDDSMNVYLEGPDTSILVVTFDNSRSEWNQFKFTLMDYWTGQLDSLRIVFIAGDNGDGHVVEAGVDAFVVNEERPTSILSKTIPTIKVFPNPTSQYLHISDEQLQVTDNTQISIINMNGRVLRRTILNGHSIYVGNLLAGTYLISIQTADQQYSAKFSVQ